MWNKKVFASSNPSARPLLVGPPVIRHQEPGKGHLSVEELRTYAPGGA